MSPNAKLTEYERRQYVGDCVERGCPDRAADGSDRCAKHRDRKRAADAAYQTRKRDRRRKDRLCIDCGKKAKYRRCPGCYKASRSQGVGVRAKGVGDSADRRTPKTPTRGHYKTEVFADGAERTRYVGQTHRGGPTREEQDVSLVKLALDARRLLEGFLLMFPARRAEIDALPRVQRAEEWEIVASVLTRSARLQLEVAGSLAQTWRATCAGCGREHTNEEDGEE